MVATGGQWRQLVAVSVLAALGTAGCGNRGDDPEPPATATPPPTGSPTPRTDPAGTATDEEFPSDPQEYAERAVAAWAAPDPVRLAELTTVEVHQQIVDLPGPPDLTWRFIRCQADPDAGPTPGPTLSPTLGTGSSDCAFYNLDGDRLVLTVEHPLLGQPRAATAMSFEVTSYPDQALAYLEEFVAAWQDDNLGRMRNLAAPAALDVYQPIPPPAEVDYQAGEPTDTVVEVVVTFPAGEVTTEISTALLGEPQAIRTAELTPAG
ncbi:MAG: hypothetical protein GEV12_22920 [Micromonosporaceae bacterium]|nr:hypothetical protein [Micromonosporaceae bacterium]